MFVDTHLHLDNYDDNEINRIIGRSIDSGVNILILGSTCKKDIVRNLSISSKFPNVFLSVGFHPEFASTFDYGFLDNIISNNLDKIVAVGEIGLDFHYEKDFNDMQKKVFQSQLELATKFSLPVVIHSRDATNDTYDILSNYDLTGVIHCFSGSYEIAKKYIKLGYFLGIGGVVTFSNSNLKDTVRRLGFDSIVFETDSPYLSPYRGSVNEPANIKVIAKFISEYCSVDLNELSVLTNSNVEKIFKIKV